MIMPAQYLKFPLPPSSTQKPPSVAGGLFGELEVVWTSSVLNRLIIVNKPAEQSTIIPRKKHTKG